MIKIGIIEDDVVMRQSLTRFFSDAAGFQCMLASASVEEFLAAWTDKTSLDIVVSDIGLPGASGIEGTRMIRTKSPDVQVMMLTIYDDSQHIFEALRAGASGYVSKQAPLSSVKDALETLYSGGSYMSPGIARKIIDYFNPIKPSRLQKPLTAREAQVLQAIEAGLPNKEIAKQFNIAAETVKSHIKTYM